MNINNKNYKNVRIIEVHKNKYNRDRDNMHLCNTYHLGDTTVNRCPLLNFKPICTIRMCTEACKDNYKECYKYLGISGDINNSTNTKKGNAL